MEMTNSDFLYENIDIDYLYENAPELFSMDVLSNIESPDDIAKFICDNGEGTPVASNGDSEDETKIPKKIWIIIKGEFNRILCSKSEEYRELWVNIKSLYKKSTPYIIVTISNFLINKFDISLVFSLAIQKIISIILFFFLKKGQKAYCASIE